MRFGFHISIAGGLSKVVDRAKDLGCQTIQIFSRSPRAWASPGPAQGSREFKEALKAAGIYPLFVHLPYLPNLATSDNALYKKSLKMLCQDLERAAVLGAEFLVVHPGNCGKAGIEPSLARIAQAINRAFKEVKNDVVLLLENTAGQGTEVGYSFAHLKKIIDKVKNKGRIDVCLDTAHAAGAGYELSTQEGLGETLKEFDRVVGLERVRLLHLNDAKAPIGSHKDRHQHIGRGYIGLEGFRRIINHPRLKDLPGIMETPRDISDIKNMEVMRSLAEK